MKTNIIFIVLLAIACVNAPAQDSAVVNPSVSRHFNEMFPQAQNLRWTALPKDITRVQFSQSGSGWIAYYDQQGNLITRGRRIKSLDNLPLQIQDALMAHKKRIEKKFGPVQIANTYEMISDDGLTRYFATLDNANAQVTVSVNTDGVAVTEMKEVKKPDATPVPKNAIAKKN